jgi:hypothetical protein
VTGTAVASWLPVLTDLTPHGLRHGHQTWMDEAGISYVLQSDRMGHEVPGMRGVYGHVSPAMRTALVAALQEMWTAALDQRAELAPRSSVAALDRLLTARPRALEASSGRRPSEASPYRGGRFRVRLW